MGVFFDVFWTFLGPQPARSANPILDFFFGPDAQGNILENVFEVARSRRNSLHTLILCVFYFFAFAGCSFAKVFFTGVII